VADELADAGGVTVKVAARPRDQQRDHHQLGRLRRRGVPADDALGEAVASGLNILVAGGTQAGKPAYH